MTRSPVPILATPRLLMTLPDPIAAEQVLAYYVDNRVHLEPWEPPRPEGFYTEPYWRDRLHKNRQEHVTDQSLRLFLFDNMQGLAGPVLGSVTLSQIVRGVFQAAYLGYSLARAHEGKGLMYEGVRAMIDYTWRELALHRLMANYAPTNERSGRLLRRLGFTVEGYARDYLFMNGAWRDHILTSLLAPAPGEEEG